MQWLSRMTLGKTVEMKLSHVTICHEIRIRKHTAVLSFEVIDQLDVVLFETGDVKEVMTVSSTSVLWLSSEYLVNYYFSAKGPFKPLNRKVALLWPRWFACHEIHMDPCVVPAMGIENEVARIKINQGSRSEGATFPPSLQLDLLEIDIWWEEIKHRNVVLYHEDTLAEDTQGCVILDFCNYIVMQTRKLKTGIDVLWKVSVHISLYFAIYDTGNIFMCILLIDLLVTVTFCMDRQQSF